MRLLRASARGCLTSASRAIEDGADINARDYNGQTPLHLACSRNNHALIKCQLQHGAKDGLQESSAAVPTPQSMASRKSVDAVPKKAFHRDACHTRCSATSSHAQNALYSNFPRMIAEAMMQNRQVAAVSRSSVSILFLDIAGFSELRGSMDPIKVFGLLERLFGAFDALAAQYLVERVDIIDGCYIAATNFCIQQPADHALRLAHFALAAIRIAASTAVDLEKPRSGTVRLLAGMHCGTVCGNVVGTHGGRKYTLHGDAVNVASRMESHGAAGAVQCSPAAAALIEAQGGCGAGGLQLLQRGEEVDVKGVGRMRPFWLSSGESIPPRPGAEAGPGHQDLACCGPATTGECLVLGPTAPCPSSPGLAPLGCEEGSLAPPRLAGEDLDTSAEAWVFGPK